MNPFGASEPQILLHARTYANSLAGNGIQPVDTLHVWYAALSNPALAGEAAPVVSALDPAKRERMLGAITYAVKYMPEPPDWEVSQPGRNFTTRLRKAEGSWQQSAFQFHGRVPDALVLATILKYDGITAELFKTFDLDPQPGYTAQMLERVAYGQPFIPFNQPVSGFPSPTPIHPENAARMTNMAKMLVQPTESNGEFRHVHTVYGDYLLQALGRSRSSREIPVLVGVEGSPLRDMAKVLSDRLHRETFAGALDSLNYFRSGVFTLNLQRMYDFQPARGDPAPQNLLEQVILYVAQERRGVLVLEHIEFLNNTNETTDAIRRALMGRGDALIFGIYHASMDETDPQAAARQYFSGATIVPVEPYDQRETLLFIQNFCQPNWLLRRRWTLEQSAFEPLFALKPGITIRSERIDLPYAIIEIAEAAIDIGDGGRENIKATAEFALNELERIRKEELPDKDVPQAMHDHFDPILRGCRAMIADLIQHPDPKIQRLQGGQGLPGEARILTRGLLLAQLFAKNASRFHMPIPKFAQATSPMGAYTTGGPAR